ncbi:hypothetical protein AB0C06_08750 [Micromonospora inaquosa]|uniref:Uncharacterized protein n=1 Tax=Micromonospora inaquosa TaxID=2203716 RepID=A0A3N9W9P6_9ACTN|nr:hypothetical protein [Micromonospora inaquosa]RQW97615.1 hypothetical protein DLJ59_28885 [Micromonospora inaquosa]
MSTLERRYRRLLRLLPAAHRTARGEELLGLLLDLDHGRRHPSRHETLNIIALAIRLRLTTPVTTTALTTGLSALLVAAGTQPAGQTLDLFTGAVLATDMPTIIASWPQIVVLGLLPLAPLIAWLCGAARTALTLQAIFLTATVGWFVIDGFNGAGMGTNLGQQLFAFAVPASILVLLVIAGRERWTAPRPRLFWWALVPLGILAWKGTGEWGRHGVYVLDAVPTVLGILAAATAAVVAAFVVRRHRPAVIVGVGLTGFLAGWLIPDPLLVNTAMRHFDGQPLPLAILITVIATTITGINHLARRHKPEVRLLPPMDP